MQFERETAEHLVSWYDKNKRKLPWRDTGNPYDVWISEIMLQQTRIEAVRDKYALFRKELPTIQDLAACEDDKLMRIWEGLGYYSRARNLKKCAQILVEKYEGKLPADVEKLKSLPGIGPYTAGAIGSICFGLPVYAVDGNVLRVLARYFEIRDDVRDLKTVSEIRDTLRSIYENKEPSPFFSALNQGLMELGETLCVPNGLPRCGDCPLKNRCRTHAKGCYEEIPYRSPLKPRKIINRTLLVIRDGDSFQLHKRSASGLLAGLYEFPGVDQTLTKEEVEKETEKMNFEPLCIKALPDSKHIFTHLEWHMKAYEITVSEIHSKGSSYVLANKKELSQLAIPSAFKTYIDWYSLRDQK